MPAERKYGMDHDHYPWSPLPSRPRLSWPDGSRLLISPVILLEFYDETPIDEMRRSRDLAGGLGDRPYPNYPRVSHREYGNRVGIFRILEAFETRGLKPTIAIDSETAKRYPELVRVCQTQASEVIAHGRAVTDIITSDMSEQEERSYISDSLQVLRQHGLETVGWLGAEYSESERTPGLLAEAGIEFVCDWCNDEQPFTISTPNGPLVATPFMVDYDDAFAFCSREVFPETYEDMLMRGLHQLRRDGETTARVMAFAIRPWLLGQPFRLGILERFLDQVAEFEDVRIAPLRDVVEGWRSHAHL